MARPIVRSAPMENKKKPQSQLTDPTAQRPKPFAVQVVDALIDGAAAIAKSMVVEPFARMINSDKKAVAGEAAASAAETEQVVQRKERNETPVAEKTAVAKKVTTKKANVRGAKKTTIIRSPAKIDTRRLATKAPKKAQRKTDLKKPRRHNA
jgi:hypothetical protein